MPAKISKTQSPGKVNNGNKDKVVLVGNIVN